MAQKPKVIKKLKEAIQYFHDRYSFNYWETDTAIGKMLKLRPEDLPYGLGGKGWTLVTHVNCPNNSLPLLWYPHVQSNTSAVRPLFPRLESQKQVESMDELHECIDIVSRDSDQCLYRFLRDLHMEP